ncbi:HAMP domain-containing histidine kinase [Bowmanella sp. Y26]|uniref:sensor histidine kinase n=1 Tax=Bowmanella yangjiangensis TaxID=2811230 RepID=UPI001BDCE424|nr:HAMP domain-containing sensor histidine kinase [Bowmanella yangjiangensis]MBT1065438.1 HAMP domain-containing histidine kinase [Bowmanella yangjiangensis]
MPTAKPYSLRNRLIWRITLFMFVALSVLSVALVLLFDSYIERRFDRTLTNQLHSLLAAAQFEPNGELILNGTPSTARFQEPLSGWYWQVIHQQQVKYQSPSLYADAPAPLLDEINLPQLSFMALEGPTGLPLRAAVQRVHFHSQDQYVFVVASGPVADIQRDVIQFASRLIGAFALLGLILGLILRWQLKQLLQPVRSLQQGIKAIRDGSQESLTLTLPSELTEVQTELNHLLQNNKEILERARLQASNLAHALKNPISVLKNHASNLPPADARIVLEQADKLSQSTHTHLARARLAGSFEKLSARTNVADTLSELVFSLELLYKPRGLKMSFACHPNLVFSGDPHDLDEVLGNLMDNACKWAHSQVKFSAAQIERGIEITIEDDGPGIPEEQRQAVFSPGKRLDETTQGTGLGLPIVQDIVLLYGGNIRLQDSSLAASGLCIVLHLPGTLAAMD